MLRAASKTSMGLNNLAKELKRFDGFEQQKLLNKTKIKNILKTIKRVMSTV